MDNLTEIILTTITFGKWAYVEVKPFRLLIWVRVTTWNRGDANDRRISCLFFDIYYRYESAQGKEGRKYRAELKSKGEWNGKGSTENK